MTPAELKALTRDELADAIAAARRPSHHLNEAFALALGWTTRAGAWASPGSTHCLYGAAPIFTSSIDRAISAAPEGWELWAMRRDGNHMNVTFRNTIGGRLVGISRTIQSGEWAMAICVAVLAIVTREQVSRDTDG